MKKLILASIVLATVFSLWNCEKDDICEDGTPTTPRMIVEFYDNNNPTLKKTVTNLAVVAEGMTDILPFNGVSKVEIPLKATANITKFNFILDSKNPILSLQNGDKLDINYTHNDVFISRACGYKTVFTLNNPNGIVLSPSIPDSNEWIQQIDIQQYNILDEDEVHVKIFF